MEEVWMHIASERNQHIKAIYCIIQTIWHSGKKKNYGNNKKISGFLMWRKLNVIGQSTENFYGSENIQAQITSITT